MAQQPIWMVHTQWRDTGRQVKVGPLDGRLMLFIVLLMLFPSMILFFITLGAMAFFYGLQYIGYTLPNAVRAPCRTARGEASSCSVSCPTFHQPLKMSDATTTKDMSGRFSANFTSCASTVKLSRS